MSESCRKDGKVWSMENLCPYCVLIGQSHCPSTGKITDGHRTRHCGIQLSHCLGTRGQVEAGKLDCCLLTQHMLWITRRLMTYSEMGESRGHFGHFLSFLCSKAGRSFLPSGLLVFISSPSLQSRMVRNETPYLIWTTRRDVLDCRFLSKDQMINHYARAGSFTTKVGV